MSAILKSIYISVLAVAGFAAVSYGVWELSPAFGKIAGGVSLLLLAVSGEMMGGSPLKRDKK